MNIKLFCIRGFEGMQDTLRKGSFCMANKENAALQSKIKAKNKVTAKLSSRDIRACPMLGLNQIPYFPKVKNVDGTNAKDRVRNG